MALDKEGAHTHLIISSNPDVVTRIHQRNKTGCVYCGMRRVSSCMQKRVECLPPSINSSLIAPKLAKMPRVWHYFLIKRPTPVFGCPSSLLCNNGSVIRERKLASLRLNSTAGKERALVRMLMALSCHALCCSSACMWTIDSCICILLIRGEQLLPVASLTSLFCAQEICRRPLGCSHPCLRLSAMQIVKGVVVQLSWQRIVDIPLSYAIERFLILPRHRRQCSRVVFVLSAPLSFCGGVFKADQLSASQLSLGALWCRIITIMCSKTRKHSVRLFNRMDLLDFNAKSVEIHQHVRLLGFFLSKKNKTKKNSKVTISS